MTGPDRRPATLSGNMIIKNGVKFDYPFAEACLSVLPICDEFVFVEGFGDDGTYEALLEMQRLHPKIKIHRERWPECKSGGEVLATMTNRAIEHCTCDYYWNIQADEAVHERYHAAIVEAVRRADFDLAFCDVLHFWSNFDTTYRPGVFYDSFARLARRSCYPRVRSYGDAMSLGVPNDDPNGFVHARIPVQAYHYGYVRKPKALIEKQAEITQFWGCQGWADLDPYLARGNDKGTIVWHEKHSGEELMPFPGTHPASFAKWIADRRQMVSQGLVG